MTFGLRRAKMLGQLFAQLVSKIFILYGHDPPTSQTDRRTDDMRSQYRALHYSASCGKNLEVRLLLTEGHPDGEAYPGGGRERHH